MELTLREVKDAYSSLLSIGKRELDFKLSYRLAKISNKLKPIVSTYETAMNGFIKQKGTLDKKDGQIKILPSQTEVITEFNETNDELMKEVHNVEIECIPIKMLESYEIPANDLQAILSLIED